MKRRDFLQNTALATAGTLWIPSFLKQYETIQKYKAGNTDKILVIIQLSGGNDGLNTIIPFENDLYYNARPKLAIPKTEVLSLNDELGLNPVMTGLRNIYEEGYLSIINNVGYPNPNRSHFRSTDIWQTASDSDEYLSTGWLGRYLDAACVGDCTTAHKAIEVDDTLSLVLKGEEMKGLALKNPKKLHKVTQSPHIQALANLNQEHENENIAYLYKTLAETVSSANYIYDKSTVKESTEEYPQNKFGNNLKTIANLINAGLETNIYYTSLGGFDTHVNQKQAQDRLLKVYSDALEVFVKDLKKNGKLSQVVVMTFSEFGRRVAQNASNGTDHGTANQVFIIGESLNKAGFYNESPNLSDLDEGDLKYSVDFRNIYATLLSTHLDSDVESVLTQKFDTLDFI